jgi:hypothetical protein
LAQPERRKHDEPAVRSGYHDLWAAADLDQLAESLEPLRFYRLRRHSMRTCLVAALSLAAAAAWSPVARAEKDADIRPLLTQPAKPAPKETFDAGKLPKGWVVNKGDFSVKDGMIVGWEKKEDMHPAVLTMQKPFKNALMRFSFNRDGATNLNLSLNHPKGHLFRVMIGEDGLTLMKDKDKKDAASKPLVLAKADGSIPSGKWHTMLVEIVGDQVAVQTDSGLKLEASHPGLNVEKTGYRFVTKGSKLLIDDVTVWELTK